MCTYLLNVHDIFLEFYTVFLDHCTLGNVQPKFRGRECSMRESKLKTAYSDPSVSLCGKRVWYPDHLQTECGEHEGESAGQGLVPLQSGCVPSECPCDPAWANPSNFTYILIAIFSCFSRTKEVIYKFGGPYGKKWGFYSNYDQYWVGLTSRMALTVFLISPLSERFCVTNLRALASTVSIFPPMWSV